MKRLLFLAVALFGGTALFAQVELSVEDFDPTSYDLDGRCLFIDLRHDEEKTLRHLPKANISRILVATEEEAAAMLFTHGINNEYACGEGMLWIEMIEE